MADRKIRFLSLVALLGLTAAGCSSIPFVGRGNDGEVASGEEGENKDGRKPVLAIEDELQPDPRFIGMLSSVEVPPAFANANWTQPGGEADHVMHHLSGPDTLDRSWKVNASRRAAKRAPVTTPPVIAENKVFTIDPEARVTAFDVQSGSRVWQTVLTPDTREEAKKFWQFGRVDPASMGFGGGVAYDAGWLYMANGFGKAASLNATTGEVRWEVQLSAPVRNPPTAVGGKVYIVTMNNQIVALDQTTGKTIWKYESFEESARVLSSGSPAVQADIVIAPFSSGEVVALDNGTGRLLWSATISSSSRLNALSTLNDIAGSPVIDRGGVFAVSHAGQLAAIDARTGGVAWEVNVSSRNTPWVSGDAIYLISVEGDLLALSRNDGAVIWREQLPAYENAKKRKGAISWSGPILAGGHLILTSSSGRMIQVNPQSGNTTNTYKLSGGTIIPPVIAGGTVYVLTDEGQLEAWN